VTYNYFSEGEVAEGEEAVDRSGMVTTYTTAQNMLVLATGELTQEQDNEERTLVSTVTLLATPQQAEVLSFAHQQGSFHLTLRSPLDEDILDLDYYNIENFETFRER